MYSLFMGLWTMLFSKVQYQILILGLDDAGKTTFLEQLKHVYAGLSPPDELKIPPTVGLNIGKLDVGRVRFLFWDLGGQSSLRVLWDKYYSDAHAVVWILDSADRERLEEAASEIARVAGDKDLREAPILVLANKQDRSDALTIDDIARALALPQGAADTQGADDAAAGPKRGASARPALAPSAASIAADAQHASRAMSPQDASPSIHSPASSYSLAAASSAAAAAAASSAAASPSAAPSASAASGLPASVSSSSSSPSPSPRPSPPASFDGHLLRLLPISAMHGTGVARAIEWLLEVLPKARRTQAMQERT